VVRCWGEAYGGEVTYIGMSEVIVPELAGLVSSVRILLCGQVVVEGAGSQVSRAVSNGKEIKSKYF
jgi:hypothetical protein